MQRNIVLVVLFVLLAIATRGAGAAPMVFTGFDTAFSKTSGADPALAVNQDMITPGVSLTRGNVQGIFNIAVEQNFSGGNPADTAWATASTSPGQAIEATNFAGLTFTSWAFAFGGKDNLATEIAAPGNNAVLHLITEDIYLDIRFTNWGGGGAFAYERSTIPEPASFVLLGVGGLMTLKRTRRIGMSESLKCQ